MLSNPHTILKIEHLLPLENKREHKLLPIDKMYGLGWVSSAPANNAFKNLHQMFTYLYQNKDSLKSEVVVPISFDNYRFYSYRFRI